MHAGIRRALTSGLYGCPHTAGNGLASATSHHGGRQVSGLATASHMVRYHRHRRPRRQVRGTTAHIAKHQWGCSLRSTCCTSVVPLTSRSWAAASLYGYRHRPRTAHAELPAPLPASRPHLRHQALPRSPPPFAALVIPDTVAGSTRNASPPTASSPLLPARFGFPLWWVRLQLLDARGRRGLSSSWGGVGLRVVRCG